MGDMNADGNPGTGAPDAGTGAAQAPGWMAQLSDDLKGNEALTGFQTISDLAKDHLGMKGKVTELEGKLGNSIPKLSENPSAEELAAYRKALGVPEKADEYEIELVDGMDNALAPWFKEAAHKLGMPKEMAKGLSAMWNPMIVGIAKAAREEAIKAHDAALAEVQKKWGDKAIENAEAVKRGYKFFGNNPLLNEFLQAELVIGDKKVLVGNHPGMVDLILEIGKRVSPDTMVGGGTQHGPGGDLDTQAKSFYNTVQP